MRYGLALFAALVTSVLSGCGAANLASLTGFDVAKREESSRWTSVDIRPGRAAGRLASLPAASSVSSSGRFTLLTYNVAGLPQWFSPTTPRANIPRVSPLLNAYDVALVQEDFSYQRELSAQTEHAFRSRVMRPRSFVGDGLSQFSRFAFGRLHRVRWERCSGYVTHAADCLADKGFSFSVLSLGDGVAIHLYNLHADAGCGRLDVEARAANFEQLGRYVEQRSENQAVIVAGDTNLRSDNDGDAETLARFAERLGLVQAYQRLASGDEPIDRVWSRSAPELELFVARWWEDARFQDASGQPLSDHPALGVEVSWSRTEPPARWIARSSER